MSELDNLLGELVENRQFDLKVTDAIKQAKDELAKNTARVLELENEVKQHEIEVALLTQKLFASDHLVDDLKLKIESFEKTKKELAVQEGEQYRERVELNAQKKRTKELLSIMKIMIEEEFEI